MTAASQRLQLITGLMSPLEIERNPPRWIFSDILAQKNIDFFRPLIDKHRVLSFEYNVLCTQLTHDFFRENANEDELTNQLLAALEMAELLAHIFRYHLDIPREVLRLQNEQKIYRDLLSRRGIQFNEMVVYEKEADWISQFVRNFTANSNWLRLFLVRSKRVLETVVPLVSNVQIYHQLVKSLDKIVGPAFSYLSWLFFIPRLSTNLFLLLKHLIPGTWMGQMEKELGFMGQTNAQLQRRWFEIGNDTAWMTAGVLSCFVWVGSLALVGVYVNIALYIYDIALASIRAANEISQLKDLQAEYKNIERDMLSNNASPEKLDEVRRFQQALSDRVEFEQKRLLLTVGNTTALAIAIFFCLPAALALSPILPLIGASLLVLITVTTFTLTQILEAYRPQSSVEQLAAADKSVFSTSKVTFFQPSASLNPDEIILHGEKSCSML